MSDLYNFLKTDIGMQSISIVFQQMHLETVWKMEHGLRWQTMTNVSM